MNNIVHDYIEKFILQNTNINLSKDLLDFEQKCIEERIPIINKEVQKIIEFLFLMLKPRKILEFGCAVGFSSIFMSKLLNDDVRITTFERDENRIKEAKKNFIKFGLDNINLIEGDCLENINQVDDVFDFIFVAIYQK